MVKLPRVSKRSRSRLLGAVLLPVAVALFLSGCMRLNIAVTLLDNDTASSTFEIALQDNAIAFMGLDPTDFWAEAEDELLYDLPAGSNFEQIAEAGWSGFNISVPAAPLDSVGNLAGLGIEDTTIYRDGDYYVFTATDVGMAQEVEMDAEYGDFFDAASLSLTFDLTCPGPVVSSNGTITGNRVHWNLADISSDVPLTARCSAVATAEGPGTAAGDAVTDTTNWFARWWPVVLIALLVLAGLALLAYYLRRNSARDRNVVAPEFETVVPVNNEQEYVAPVVAPLVEEVEEVTDAYGAPEQWQIDDTEENDR